MFLSLCLNHTELCVPLPWRPCRRQTPSPPSPVLSLSLPTLRPLRLLYSLCFFPHSHSTRNFGATRCSPSAACLAQSWRPSLLSSSHLTSLPSYLLPFPLPPLFRCRSPQQEADAVPLPSAWWSFTFPSAFPLRLVHFTSTIPLLRNCSSLCFNRWFVLNTLLQSSRSVSTPSSSSSSSSSSSCCWWCCWQCCTFLAFLPHVPHPFIAFIQIHQIVVTAEPSPLPLVPFVNSSTLSLPLYRALSPLLPAAAVLVQARARSCDPHQSPPLPSSSSISCSILSIPTHCLSPTLTHFPVVPPSLPSLASVPQHVG